MRTLGVPYTDADIAAAPAQVSGKTELDALVAYLQSLGTAVKSDDAVVDSPPRDSAVPAPARVARR
jgi:cytochrome c oxidase cbb3-type subunit 2